MANANFQEFYNALFVTIENITKSVIEKQGVDRTYKGKVVEVLGNNMYKVAINNNTYSIKHKANALNKGDDVFCTICCGNWNNIVVHIA